MSGQLDFKDRLVHQDLSDLLDQLDPPVLQANPDHKDSKVQKDLQVIQDLPDQQVTLEPPLQENEGRLVLPVQQDQTDQLDLSVSRDFLEVLEHPDHKDKLDRSVELVLLDLRVH